MRPIRIALVLLASAVTAFPATARAPTIPPIAQSALPGLPPAADQSLWCASMASELAGAALENGDYESYGILAPLAVTLTQQISSLFVTLSIAPGDAQGFMSLYADEIDRVLAGAAPERFAPEECRTAVQPGLVA